MHYFLDTEFWEAGPHRPIELISLGLVSEDNRELYIENGDANLKEAVKDNPWLGENVIPHLTWPVIEERWRGREEIITDHQQRPPGTPSKVGHMLLPHSKIGNEVLKFIRQDMKPKFWGYFSDYDWVLFAQLFGKMVDIPSRLPMYCRDLKQEMDRLGIQKSSIPFQGTKHNALDDARWTKAIFDYIFDSVNKSF
jgi:hypothetical protein